MVRTIITPKDNQIHLSIAQEYVGKPIEITYLALDELSNLPPEATMDSFFGILPEQAYLDLKTITKQARKEWNRNV